MRVLSWMDMELELVDAMERKEDGIERMPEEVDGF